MKEKLIAVLGVSFASVCVVCATILIALGKSPADLTSLIVIMLTGATTVLSSAALKSTSDVKIEQAVIHDKVNGNMTKLIDAALVNTAASDSVVPSSEEGNDNAERA